MYVHLWLIHTELGQKAAKFCRAIILQPKSKAIKKYNIFHLIFILYWSIVAYNVLISGVRQSDSVLYIHILILSQIISHIVFFF